MSLQNKSMYILNNQTHYDHFNEEDHFFRTGAFGEIEDEGKIGNCPKTERDVYRVQRT